MAGGNPDADAVKKAPLAFRAWANLRGSVNVALPAALRNAARYNAATRRIR